MPFEKKKKYKTPKDYKQKNLYLNLSDPYQNECYKLLQVCGHKQAKFIGLLVHDYIQKMGINIDALDDKTFTKLIGLLEVQASGGMNGAFSQMGMVMQPMMVQTTPYSGGNGITSPPKAVIEEGNSNEDDGMFEMDEAGLKDMNEALAAFKF